MGFDDETTGFSVEIDPLGPSVCVTAKGFWSVEVAAAFAPKVVEVLRLQPRGASVVFDMRGLKPMRDEGQQAFSEVLTALKLPKRSLKILTLSPLTKLQLLRIVKEAGLTGDVEFA